MVTHTLRHFSLATLCLAAVAPSALAQSAPEDAFHEAYYLHHELGDLEGALPLYRRAAADQNAPERARRQSARLAEEITEELASSDFARLAPPGTIFYLELNRPGAQLQALIEQLGLSADGAGFGISPRLVRGLLGVRGAAFAVTEIDPRSGPRGGVAILHPGGQDVVRGLLETALPAAGEPVEPIGGHPTYKVEGEVFVTMTSRLVLVSPNPAEIEGVIGRLADGGGDGGLAGRESLRTAMAMRGDDLMFFCVHLEPIMPMLTSMIRHEARRDPGAQAALELLDLQSTNYIAGRAGVGDDGLSLDLAVELDEGHRNIAFNLMRLPPLDEGALEMVPSGAALFWAAGINHKGPVPGGATDAQGRPIVTLLDFGREAFANVADVALFALPTAQSTPAGPIPDAALTMRVNDPERSRALWRFVLGTAQTASGGGQDVASLQQGEVAIDRYEVQGIPVFVAVDDHHVVVSPSEAAVSRAIEARRKGESVRTDPAFRTTLAALGDSCTEAMALSVGRCGELASQFMSDRERREAMPILGMMRDTSMWIRFDHGARRLAWHGSVVGVPEIGGMVEQLIRQQMHGTPARRVGAVSAQAVPSRQTVTTSAQDAGAELIAAFATAHAAGRHDVAVVLARKICEVGSNNPVQLNGFAWALLTDEQYENAYDEVALDLAKAANEASEWSNWYCLDTYATSLFRHGRVDEAIEFQRKAIAVGADDPRIDEAKASLQRFLAAKGEQSKTAPR